MKQYSGEEVVKIQAAAYQKGYHDGWNSHKAESPALSPDPYPDILSRITTLFFEGKGNEEIVQVLREEWVISKK